VLEKTVTTLCEENKVPVHKWLGGPKERKSETKVHTDMVCGVSVGPLPLFVATALKDMGFAGSAPAMAMMSGSMASDPSSSAAPPPPDSPLDEGDL
jgi:hypothetical protein